MKRDHVIERRAVLSKILFETPMTKNELAEATGIPAYIVADDLHILSFRFGIAEIIGTKYTITEKGKRKASIWKCNNVIEIDTLKNIGSQRLGNIPDLSPLVLSWMGYTNHKPEGGRFVDNENFHQESSKPSRVKVHIGNHWGIMMEASQ